MGWKTKSDSMRDARTSENVLVGEQPELRANNAATPLQHHVHDIHAATCAAALAHQSMRWPGTAACRAGRTC